MALTARAVHQVKATSRYHIQLIPTPLQRLKLAPPIPNAGGADVRWRTVRSGPVQQERGRKLAPRQCCRPCEAWLRHDAKMLVTPRAGMQSGEWRRTSPWAAWGGEGCIRNDQRKGPDPPRSPLPSPRAPSAARRSRLPPLGVIPLDLCTWNLAQRFAMQRAQPHPRSPYERR